MPLRGYNEEERDTKIDILRLFVIYGSFLCFGFLMSSTKNTKAHLFLVIPCFRLTFYTHADKQCCGFVSKSCSVTSTLDAMEITDIDIMDLYYLSLSWILPVCIVGLTQASNTSNLQNSCKISTDPMTCELKCPKLFVTEPKTNP